MQKRVELFMFVLETTTKMGSRAIALKLASGRFNLGERRVEQICQEFERDLPDPGPAPK
jgi:hypothetical protein